MAGTPEGGKKASLTKIKKYGEDFYREIGRKSWENDRDHNVGFAKLDKETLKEISARGGKKTKKDYKSTEKADASEPEEISTGVSE